MTHFNWWLDGSIIGLYLLATMVAGLWVRKYVGKVEDFLVAGREMNVYLGIASLAATEFGIVTCMYTAQNGYDKGFAGAVPGVLMAAAMFVVGVTGFCVKPLRDSGVMTIPELFERTFGVRVRWLAGVVIVLGGLLNMGVFLRMGGDFLVTVTGMGGSSPAQQEFYLKLTMTVLLVGVAVYTILGGMLSVLITDFLQFVVMSAGLIVVTFFLLGKVSWGTMVATVQQHYGAGGFNPFANPGMGVWYVVFNALIGLAVVLTWQPQIARVLAAKDSKTGRKVYTGTAFFFVCRFMIPGLWGIAALALIPKDVVAGNSLLAMPKMLAQFIPVGLMGVLIAAMLAADMSTDSSYMLTWASVIYNDIIAPFRTSAWTEKRGLMINRFIVAAIGIFLLLYGLWYKLEGDLWTYLGLTGSVYLSSMSVLLISCCYWKRANSWGAYGAIVLGALMPILSLVLQKRGPWTQWFIANGPLTGVLTFAAVALAMVVGSLLKPPALAAGPKVS